MKRMHQKAGGQPSQDVHSFLSAPVVLSILVTELGERFSYFGFRAILVLYFTSALQFSETDSIALFAYMTCLAYLSPILGAVLADGALGSYRTILWFGIIYVIGLCVLTFSAWSGSGNLEASRMFTFLALFLICLGTGGIKPCVSAFGADQVTALIEKDIHNQSVGTDHGQYQDSVSHTDNKSQELEELPPFDHREKVTKLQSTQDELIRVFFNYFYLCINVGAVTSLIILPFVRGRLGFGAAFFVSTGVMVFAMLLFVSKSTDYVHTSHPSSLGMTFRLTWWLLRHQIWSNPVVSRLLPFCRPGPMPPFSVPIQEHSLVPVTEEDAPNHGIPVDNADQHDLLLQEHLDDAAKALHVLPIIALFPVFWCLYDQQSSVWTLQATRMELNGLQPEQLNVVNPVEIMIFIPLFEKVIYPTMDRMGLSLSHLSRMAYGMLWAALAFVCSGLVESTIQYRELNNLPKVNVFWQLPQITFLAIGEILVSVTGLEFAYATSPERLKAFLMAINLLTTAVGDLFSGVMYSTVFRDMNRATVMHVCGGLMVANLVVFVWVSRWWERSSFRDVRRAVSLEGLEFQDRRLV